MKHFKKIIQTIIVLLYCFTASAQTALNTDSLASEKHILKQFRWFRERIKTLDDSKKWTYYANGNEYIIKINYYVTKGALFSSPKMQIKTFSWGHKKDTQETDVSWLPLPNKIFYSSQIIDSIPISSSYYMAQGTDTYMYDITMYTYGLRDTILEKQFVSSIIKNEINDSLFLMPGPNMFDFAGRIVELRNYFAWEAPDNLYCPSNGQMSWSIHTTMDMAIRARNIQLKSNSNWKKVELLKADTITVSFEGLSVQAIRMTYKAKVAKIFWGRGSTILIVYYITAPVRNQYVTCILSHYDDQWLNGDVPPPLNSVMSLFEKPKSD